MISIKQSSKIVDTSLHRWVWSEFNKIAPTLLSVDDESAVGPFYLGDC